MAQALGYLSKNKAYKEKDRIRNRLHSLRSGPFGDPRREAKRLLEKEAISPERK